jgi:cyclopropane fatty-acyl-phospholipid synthase-like methyltransferase
MQSKPTVQGIVRDFPKEASPSWITAGDLSRSMTAHMLADLHRALAPLQGQELRRMLDIGCGFGGVACFTADLLGISERHGVDRDEDALREPGKRGLRRRTWKSAGILCHIQTARLT